MDPRRADGEGHIGPVVDEEGNPERGKQSFGQVGHFAGRRIFHAQLKRGRATVLGRAGHRYRIAAAENGRIKNREQAKIDRHEVPGCRYVEFAEQLP